MRIPLAISALILAIGASIGWYDSQQLASIREIRGQLIAEAAQHGIVPDLSNSPGSAHITKHDREDREASAKRTAAQYLAFGKEREAFEKTAAGHRDPAVQKEMIRRMAEFRERMMAMEPAQMAILIAEVRSDSGLADDTRRRLFDVAVLALSNNHPQAVLELFAGESERAKDDVMGGGYIITSSLARWAKEDPLAALAWIHKNSDKNPDLITEEAKRGLISGAAMQDPKLAFQLIGELGLKGSDNVIQSIVGVARTPDEKLATLAMLREHLATHSEDPARDQAARDGLTMLANGIVQDGFTSACQWLAAADLSPVELAGVAAGLNYDPSKSGETGQWIEWLGKSLPPGAMAADRIQYLVASWTHNDPQAAGQWLATTPDGPARNTAIRSYAETISRFEPHTAAQWALTLPAGQDRDATLKTIYQNWPRNDPAGAAAFGDEHGLR